MNFFVVAGILIHLWLYIISYYSVAKSLVVSRIQELFAADFISSGTRADSVLFLCTNHVKAKLENTMTPF